MVGVNLLITKTILIGLLLLRGEKNMFFMKVLNQGWYCDDCGYIDDFSIICKFNDKIIKEEYDDHFGNCRLQSSYFDEYHSFKILIEPFIDEFKKQGIDILEIKEDEVFLTDFDLRDTMLIVRMNINDENKTFVFVTGPIEYEKSPDKDKNLYQEFFKFIGIDFVMENESEDQANETDWLY